MRQKLIHIGFLLIIFSCSQSEIEKYDLGGFTIETKIKLNRVSINGIDSNMTYLISDKGDTIFYDFGIYASNLESPIENDRIKVLTLDYVDSLKRWGESLDEFVFVNSLKNRMPILERLKLHNQYVTKIDGQNARVVETKNVGKGIIGVVFENLKTDESGNNITLNFWGRSKNWEKDQQIRMMISSIKIKK